MTTFRMSDWDNGECRPVLDRAQFLAGISWTLSFACEFSTLIEWQTCLLCRFLTSSDFFSLQKSDVASHRVFETVDVSDERSFPGPQLLSQLGSRKCSQIPLTSTLSHLPDVPPVLLQLSFLVIRPVTCGDQSVVVLSSLQPLLCVATASFGSKYKSLSSRKKSKQIRSIEKSCMRK